MRVAALGYAMAIGNSGTARADFLRRTSGAFWSHELQLDARYQLFDRLFTGVGYTGVNRYDSGAPSLLQPEHDAHVWVGADLPAGSHEIGVTLLQHYTEAGERTLLPTDVALRYSLPLSRVRAVVAADATNVLGRDRDTTLGRARAMRFWIRLRL
jgi:hypothetical protein